MSYKKESSMGTISLIFGILGCIGILPCLGSIIAIIAGFAGRGTTDESNAKIGLILGWIGCCLYIGGIVVMLILWLAVGIFSYP